MRGTGAAHHPQPLLRIDTRERTVPARIDERLKSCLNPHLGQTYRISKHAHLETAATLRTLVAQLWLTVVLVLLCEPSWCTNAGPFVISIPEGFEGPSRSDEDGGVTIGWVKRQPASVGGTLLQVSAIDVGASLDGISSAQRIEATAHYLMEFVKGIGQRLGDFEFGDIDQASLAGLPAARVRWTGTVKGRATIGVMYCVLVRHSVVSLQTQDVGSELTPAMYTAIGAIEGVRVR
jgi:hypothetical protein